MALFMDHTAGQAKRVTLCAQEQQHTTSIFSTVAAHARSVVKAHTDPHPPAARNAPQHNALLLLERTEQRVAEGKCLMLHVNLYAMAHSIISTHQQHHVRYALKIHTVPHPPCAANAV